MGQTASIEIRKCMGTYFVAVAWIFSIVKISSRLSYGNLSSQVKLHIKIWQDDLCSNMNITTIFKKDLFYSKTKYLWYDCQLSAFYLNYPCTWRFNTIKKTPIGIYINCTCVLHTNFKLNVRSCMKMQIRKQFQVFLGFLEKNKNN